MVEWFRPLDEQIKSITKIGNRLLLSIPLVEFESHRKRYSLAEHVIGAQLARGAQSVRQDF